MRLPNENLRKGMTLALALAMTSCGVVGGAPRADVGAIDSTPAVHQAATGPAADYPVVLGEPYSIDGIEYVPADVWNYDEVGYASAVAEDAVGVSASHRTLPLPSYVEVTSLETGKTILVRVERRGPLVNSRLLGLSSDALNQLEASEATAIRVRRVNPPESERAMLRAGEAATSRLDTPMSLVAVLKRKLPAIGSASLIEDDQEEVALATFEDAPESAAEQIVVQDVLETAEPVAHAPAPAVAASAAEDKPKQAAVGDYVIQAAAFSNKANAEKAAMKLAGFVETKGKFYHVRTGPYTSRGQANAALAKVKAAGYSDARVIKAG